MWVSLRFDVPRRAPTCPSNHERDTHIGLADGSQRDDRSPAWAEFVTACGARHPRWRWEVRITQARQASEHVLKCRIRPVVCRTCCAWQRSADTRAI
jgi:hypothetical protein